MVDRPDIKGRREILKVHVKGKPVGSDVELDVIARRTPGFTGADLSNLVNEAALMAARRNKKQINMPDMEEAAERVIMGPERRSRVISDNEKRLTAYHEGGHTLVGMLLVPHTTKAGIRLSACCLTTQTLYIRLPLFRAAGQEVIL